MEEGETSGGYHGNTSSQEAQQSLMDDIQETIDKTDSWLQSMLQTLGWTEDHILQKEDIVTCPVDTNHRMPRSHMDKHLTYCPLVRAGYTKLDLEREREKSSKFFYENAQTVVSMDLDEETIRNVIGWNNPGTSNRPLPVTMDRMMSDLSTNEKARLYEFCVQTAKATNKLSSLKPEEIQLLENDDDSNTRPQSHLELRAAERDLKRRRQSYRKKTVHTANKSYSEVIREVIEQQTGLLTERWQTQHRSRKRPARLHDDARASDEKNHRDKTGDRSERHKSSKGRSSSPEGSESSSHSRRKHKHKKHKKHKHKSDRHTEVETTQEKE